MRPLPVGTLLQLGLHMDCLSNTFLQECIVELSFQTSGNSGSLIHLLKGVKSYKFCSPNPMLPNSYEPLFLYHKLPVDYRHALHYEWTRLSTFFSGLRNQYGNVSMETRCMMTASGGTHSGDSSSFLSS
jgi:hypothetical protein